uniref:Uncharacterized protein n=1 Tax=Vespula pensylvanica TaxID=30213 RepID=A0A834UDP0_VESPE|nr:hypothetical protein H0235_005225 [Vespula pensylvanica]
MAREAFRVKIAEIASSTGWWMKHSRSLYVTVVPRRAASHRTASCHRAAPRFLLYERRTDTLCLCTVVYLDAVLTLYSCYLLRDDYDEDDDDDDDDDDDGDDGPEFGVQN